MPAPSFIPRNSHWNSLLSLLTGDTDSLTVTASGACLLTTHTHAPTVTETTVSPALPEALEGLAHLGVQKIGIHVGSLTSLMSFFLLTNHDGMKVSGFWMTATTLSISSLVSSPARLLRSISAFLHTMLAKR